MASLTAAFAREAVRVPTTWVVLLVVPIVFVAVAAPALSEAARILAGGSGRVPIEQVAPAWSAGFVTGLAVFFQVFEGRSVDQRLTVAGMPATLVAVARFATGLAVAAVTSLVSLATLALSSPTDLGARVAWATAAAAVVYLAIGMVVAVASRTVVAGTTTILLVWILDTFFGPAMNATTSGAVRVLPSHYVTLWLLDAPVRHGGPAAGAAAIGWVVAALLTSLTLLVLVAGLRRRRTGTADSARPDSARPDSARHPRHRAVARVTAGAPGAGRGDSPVAETQPVTVPARLAAEGTATPAGTAKTRRRAPVGANGRARRGPRGVSMAALAGLDLARTAALWVLLAVVPVVFIVLADRTTPHGRDPVTVWEAGVKQIWWFDPADIHAGTMAPVAVAALSMLAGVYIAADTRPGDRRLALAGMPASVIATVRVLLAAAAAGIATAVSVGVTALLFTPRQPGLYLLGNALLGVTYALLGLLLGARLGRVTGTFVAFLVPFLDIGLSQSPMLRPDPPGWAAFLPGWAPVRVVVDAALTPRFDQAGALLLALAWTVAAAGAAALVVGATSRRVHAAAAG